MTILFDSHMHDEYVYACSYFICAIPTGSAFVRGFTEMHKQVMMGCLLLT